MPVTHFIWDRVSDNVLSEVDDAGVETARYMNEPDQFGNLLSQRRSGTNSFYHFDAQGSARQLTNDAETVTDSYSYTAFGEPVTSSGATSNPFQYNGTWGYYSDEETGEVYVRRRTYSPNLGHWMSCDPLLFIDGTNLYRYVQNQPMSAHDPLGSFSENSTGSRGTRKVCCTFDNGSEIWSWEFDAVGSETAADRCKKRATWGWGRDWIVINAREGRCDPWKRPSGTAVETAAVGVCFFITTDACTPEPTDLFPPKWICYAIIGALAGAIVYKCCSRVDPCWNSYEACLLSSFSSYHNRCWDCYLACSGLGEWYGKMNGIDCDYWNH